MTTKRKTKPADDGTKVRTAVAAFTHEEAFVLLQAARAAAASLREFDGRWAGSHEMRDDADRLDDLAELLRRANAARNFIEGGE